MSEPSGPSSTQPSPASNPGGPSATVLQIFLEFLLIGATSFGGGRCRLSAFFGPTSLLTLIVGCLWNRLTKWPWRVSIQKGLAPVSIGLLLAGCFTLAKGAVSGLETATIAVAVLLLLLQYKINPALLVLGGALIGALSFGPK